jgi:hypothetical protein
MQYRALGFLAALFSEPVSADSLQASVYYPVNPGEFSSFVVDRMRFETLHVLQAPEVVGGVVTNVVELRGSDGYPREGRTNVTNDVLGVRTHRMVVIGEDRVDRSITFTPPWKRADRSFGLGDVLSSSGSAFWELSTGASFMTSFSSTTHIDRVEPLEVLLFGRLEALVVRESITFTDAMSSVTTTMSTWRAPGLGIIREEVSDSLGTNETKELLTTNRQLLPEPTISGLRAVVLVMLARLAAHRRRLASVQVLQEHRTV